MRGDSLQCRILYINIGEQSQLADAKSKFCPNAGVTSGMCKAGKPEKVKLLINQRASMCCW